MIDENFNYYQAPSDEIFNEIKSKAMEIWKTYDNTYGYVTEKLRRIEPIRNIQDNAWYIVGMFDSQNQQKLIHILEEPAKTAVKDVLEWFYLQSL